MVEKKPEQAFCNADVVYNMGSITMADRNEKVIWVGSIAVALQKPGGSKMQLLLPLTQIKRLKGHSSVQRLGRAA